MSSAGHALDGINRIKYNESIKKKRVDRIKKLKDLYIEELNKKIAISFEDKDVSKEELEEIKSKIRTALKKQTKRSVIQSIIITILFVTLSIVAFRYLILK